MKIESPSFGTLEVTEDKIIEFPGGLPGFEDNHRFTLLHEEGGEGVVFQLQSVDDPAVALSITSPGRLGVNLEIALSDEEVDLLGMQDSNDAAVMVVVRKPDADTPANAGLVANFLAPLVINVNTRRGIQKVVGHAGYDITLRALA